MTNITKLVNKTCSRCQEEKLVSEFGRHSNNKDGYESMCKPCRSAHRYENGDYVRERIRKHTMRHNDRQFYTDKTIEYVVNATHCLYCGDEMNRIRGDAKQTTMDHVYRGSNIDENVVVACRSCNSLKHTKHIYAFYEASERFTPELWDKFVRLFIGRMVNREITDKEVVIMTERFKAESTEYDATMDPLMDKEAAV